MSFSSRGIPSSEHAYSPAGELLLSRHRAARSSSKDIPPSPVVGGEKGNERGDVPFQATSPRVDSTSFRQRGEGVGKKGHAPRSPSKSARLSSFRKTVWDYWRKEGRHELPWRNLPAGRQGHMDPYKILVSEVMLQQTQVERVIPKYKAFLKRFPTVRALARSSLRDVLVLWSGLGYNRRAKYLHDAAKYIVEKHKGMFPREYTSLRAIPGVGQYTANAVRVFAYNEYEVLIETNVRTAIIHHFFGNRRNIPDEEIEKYAAKVAQMQDPREWHSALFDYGAYLKRQGISHNSRSKRYVKQSKFAGSLREVRGAILRARTERKSLQSVKKRFPERFEKALQGLKRDGLISRR